MKRYHLSLVLALLFCTQAWADYDAALEAEEQAKHEAEQREQLQQQQAAQKVMNEARAKANAEMTGARRKALGAAAAGKSDAEVEQLYDAKIEQDTAAAMQGAQQAREALSSGQGAAAVQQVTGKSLEQLENMSDAEAEALAREMEKKYGQ